MIFSQRQLSRCHDGCRPTCHARRSQGRRQSAKSRLYETSGRSRKRLRTRRTGRLFADPSKPLDDPSQPQGVSVVKAIAIAASQGQRIYSLTAHNAAYHANILASLDTNENTKTEIHNALSAGMEVTVHQADISVYGWTGSGYIILDPETGAGAYKISGGMNGGYLIGAMFGLIAVLGGSMMAYAFSVTSVVLALTLIILGGMLAAFSFLAIDEADDGCIINGFITLLSVGTVAVAFRGSVTTAIFSVMGLFLAFYSSNASTTPKSQCP
ncbi:MAG: hypothetical protein AB1717_02710 [Pseudomonadota bacterium]